MTGTPVTQGPLDIYSQFEFLDKKILGFANFFAFRATFAVMKPVPVRGRTIQIVDKYINLDQLKNKIEPYSYRVLKKDCLDLPEKIYTKIYHGLSDEQESLYRQMADDFIASVGEQQVITAQIALTKLLRLRQIIGGFVPVDELGVKPIEPNNRLKTLTDLLEDIQGSTIIWAVFKAEIAAIKNVLGSAAVTYYGETSTEARAEAVKAFQEGRARYFIGNPRAAGLGLTLTRASNVIYYSNDYSLEIRQQSEDRAHRIGQRNVVTYFDLIAEGTLDEKIIDALRSKRDIASTITGDELKAWL